MLLDSLARLDMGRAPLSEAFMQLLVDNRRDSHMVVVTPHLGQVDASRLKLLLNKGVSVLVVALLWDEDDADTMGTAAALGCQVVGVHPGQDLATALFNEVAGVRR
jgi:hypothetical protein